MFRPRLMLLASALIACSSTEATPTSEPATTTQPPAPPSSPPPTPPVAAPSASAPQPASNELDLRPWGHEVSLTALPGMKVSLPPTPGLLNVPIQGENGLEVQVLHSFGAPPTAASHQKMVGSLLTNTKFITTEEGPEGFLLIWETDCAFGSKRETGFALYDKKTNEFCQSGRMCKSKDAITPLIAMCKTMRPR